ncbi:MAG: CARDB domain-containing protein, partial [Desulfobacterales bacterium]|nr:CARDB domain-containing protein [Desulfobacterales bacterium]
MDEFAPVPAGGSYTASRTYTPSAGRVLGQKFLILKVNYWTDIGETDLTNNTLVRPVTLAAPDLVITATDSPAVLSWGQYLTLIATMTNQGTVEAAGGWYDYLYISPDQTFETADYQLDYAWHSNGNPVAAGGQYSASFWLSLDDYLLNEWVNASRPVSGNYYLIFYADRSNYQGETNETNNQMVVPVTLTAPPDLQVTTTNGPSSGSPSGTIEVSWTMSNSGGATGRSSWYDQIYLSTDQTYDSNDAYLYSQGNMGVSLAAGQSALLFDGNYSRVRTELNLNQTTGGGGITMEAWVYPVSSGSGRMVMSTNSWSGQYHW